MEESGSTELSPYYYRDNFLRLCDTVEAQYGDILTGEERLMLRRFRHLDFKSQCLYIRLVSRSGPWFRESKLAYSELGPPGPLLDNLVAQEMAREADALPAGELGKLYTHNELLKAFSSRLAAAKYQGKAALLGAIDALQLDAAQIRQALVACDPQRLVGPHGVELVKHLQLLFFGNRHQTLTEFVLEDLGVTRYYPYPLDRNHRFFPCREAFDEYLACAALSDDHRALQEQGELNQLPELAARILAMTTRFPSSEKCWHRLCNNLARDLERQGQWDMALQLYSRSLRHPARERRARILERRSDWAGADALCAQILCDPWCEEERDAATCILPRVKRKLDGSRLPRRRDNFRHMTLRLPSGSDSVEHRAATHLQSQWQSVHYVENALMNSLFGLAFWEQIFEAVPGVFHHPYQSVPTDMYDRAFRARRLDSIAARMKQLREGRLTAILGEAYLGYKPCQCHWVDWHRIDADLIDTAARTIPATHLLAIWERMLFDPRENRRGFPDLIALGKGEGNYCLIEVKGPGDALQESQKRWLRFFQTQQIPAQVAWVEWHDD